MGGGVGRQGAGEQENMSRVRVKLCDRCRQADEVLYRVKVDE
ncbi:hypothetical protein [Leptolyngbya ohadii]|nr:hypothetical protein [Leptolyngbya ohadii]